MTAHYLVHDYVKLGPGKTVLVHAAAGGVGLLVVQWAKYFGARVVGTVSTEAKARVARAAGADDVVIYGEGNAGAVARYLSDGRGADLVLDGVRLATLAGSIDAAADGGSIVNYGFPSGLPESVAPSDLIARGLRLAGGNLIPATADRNTLLARASDVLAGVGAGWVSLRFDASLPLAEAVEAHRLLEGRETTGKLVLRV